ncbi:cytochrome P450 [Pyrenophora seminiperda CCB06]|uniref:Cytochrome P450 n=1 Tax=Pyrenophora seminiperda CCB06 TaxID=1302712 RepID=A0A3M7M442_9PLEO|nr:cytochrome P450 [Pyrenophora seminiperda CCB06]
MIHPIDIATLPMLTGNIHVIFDLQLMQKALSSRAMSFEPLLPPVARPLLGLSPNVMQAIHSGMLSSLIHATKPALVGKPLTRLNSVALRALVEYLDDEILQAEELEISDLYRWLGIALTIATGRALYGSQCPLSRDRKLIDDLWSFKNGSQRLMVNILPRITASKAYRARERLISALTPLFEVSMQDTIEDVSRIRARVHREFGNTGARDIARCEVAMLHVATVNTTPLLFWTVINVFSRLDLVEAIRNECMALAEVSPQEFPTDTMRVTISASQIGRRCPLLMACYRETCRLNGQALLIRLTSEDVVLNKGRDGGAQHLIDAESQVMMPAGVTHRLEEVWGSDASEFRPERFIGWPDTATSAQRSAFIPFGSGRHICPGRHLAQSEILGLILILCLGYDMLSADGPEIAIRIPTMSTPMLGSAVGEPAAHEDPVGIKIRRRCGWERVSWTFVS